MRLFLPAVLFISLCCCTSCGRYQPADSAFFVKSPYVNVLTTGSQGTGSHRISDLWFYVNGQFEGAYPLGNLMPVPSRGKPVTLDVFAGIRNNGISSTRLSYPLYAPLKLDTFVNDGSVVQRPFTFRYRENVKFAYNENFDSSIGFAIQKSDVSDTTFAVAEAGQAFEVQSISLGLDGTARVAQIETAGEGFTLPAANSSIYLELNYKCNTWFSVGLIDDNRRLREVIILGPQDNWNKTYISLSEAANNPNFSGRYKVYFRMLKNDNSAGGRIFIDNIKVAYLS